MTNHEEYSVLETARKMLVQHPLCDRCLGRQFAWLGSGTTNEDRGHSIKLTLCMIADKEIKSGDKASGEHTLAILAGNGMFAPARTIATKNSIEYVTSDSCHLCFIDGSSIFEKIPLITERMVGIADQVEFETFLAGCVPSPLLVERQDEISAIHSALYSETLKSHFNRLAGIQLQELLGKSVDFEKPDVVFIYDMNKDEVGLHVNPIFIFGRYKKLVRGIPQSRWDCKKCKGRGCEECEGTGRNYPDSISEYVGIPAQQCAGGSRFKFHAAGREDVDVLMLGKGRPFVVEISKPRVRKPDLLEMAQTINQEAAGKIEVHDLELTDRHRLQKLKEDAASNIKEYAAIIHTEGLVTDEAIQRVIQSFQGATIEQRTPNRVSHRRSDLVRKKKVHGIKLTKLEEGILEAFFKVQGGTYIKELISGDDGRTKPSVAEILGTACVCKVLNVTAIYSSEN
ncbi:MAG: tRNA pseudouridine(54/55) synthase Pus10 [Candidatus Thorarchaeota archaeon]|nr:tRNA pseudouridine(54/55) synthase Pus10 [Candidatus Thorarchaeota archaeon]